MTPCNIGFAVTGSFCTFKSILPEIQNLKNDGHNIIPIMSHNAYSTDTRFGSSDFFRNEIKKITGNQIISEISQAEPIGPRKLLDLLIIAPCTGNSLAKLANGIADTSVTLAAKSHLRNSRPLLIAVSTNDALSAAAKNIGNLLNYKNIYFVPMKQDDSENKPRSVVADFSKIRPSAEAALQGNQMQPIIFH